MLETVMVNEERYRPIVENNVDGIMIVDQNGTTRYVNKAAEALLGPKAKGPLDEAFEFPFSRGGTTSVELLRPDGGVTIAEVRVRETQWDGETAHALFLRDVTECLKTTDRLEGMGRLVAEAKYVMVFVVTCDGRITACNALASETFGYTEREILSQHMNTLFGSAKDEVWRRISESVSQEMQWRGELVGVCKDGREFPVDMAVSRPRSQGRAEAGIICFVRDVRKEKKIDQMKSEYISMASHEMRTPLTSIKNAVDMVLRRKAGSITEIQEKFMLMAERNINRLGTH